MIDTTQRSYQAQGHMMEKKEKLSQRNRCHCKVSKSNRIKFYEQVCQYNYFLVQSYHLCNCVSVAQNTEDDQHDSEKLSSSGPVEVERAEADISEEAVLQESKPFNPIE